MNATLQEEVVKLGHGDDRVVLYADLKAFRRDYLESAPDDKRLIEELLRDDVALWDEFDEYVRSVVFREIEARSQLRLTGAHEENVHVVRGTVDDIEIVDAYEATDESVVVDLRAVCSVDVQFYVLKDEAHLLDRRDRRMISDWDADENYALGEADYDELQVELTGTFDRVYRYLEDLEVISIS